MNTKYLMTALCALGVAGFAKTSEAARIPHHHRGSATKHAQHAFVDVAAGLADHAGHALIDAALGGPAVVAPAPAVVVRPIRPHRRPRYIRPTVVVEQPTVVVQQPAPVVVQQPAPVVVQQPVAATQEGAQPTVVQPAQQQIPAEVLQQQLQNQQQNQ